MCRVLRSCRELLSKQVRMIVLALEDHRALIMLLKYSRFTILTP